MSARGLQGQPAQRKDLTGRETEGTGRTADCVVLCGRRQRRPEQASSGPSAAGEVSAR